MRLLICLFVLLALIGCAAPQRSVAVTPLPQPIIAGVAEGLDKPPEGQFEAIGYLYSNDAGAALVGGLSFSYGDIPTPLAEAGAIWLPSPPALAVDATAEAAGGARYSIVRASGSLSSQGSYGPGNAYSYQLTEVTLEPLGVRDLSIELLLSNSSIYDNQPVRIAGQLLLNDSTALLVEQLGSGGVPVSDARQIKLVGPVEGGALLDHLSATAGGGAHFGSVQIVGISRRGVLYPLAIIPG
ncbi:MAG: hypothetical protein HGA19_07940 [Oscillochloris sp.]|nr:hypothetical protein [Oscillochloris sp.]